VFLQSRYIASFDIHYLYHTLPLISVLGFEYRQGPRFHKSGRFKSYERDSGTYGDILKELAMSNRKAIMKRVATSMCIFEEKNIKYKIMALFPLSYNKY
jgi:hypothetical protein